LAAGVAVSLAMGAWALRPDANHAAAEAAPVSAAAEYSLFGPPLSATDWLGRQAPALRAAFQREIYGQLPDLPAPLISAREIVRAPSLRRAKVHAEQWAIRLGDSPHRFNMLVITPEAAQAPLPVIVMQVFCGNRTAVPGRPRGVAAPLNPVMSVCNMSFADPIVHGILGRYINGPPIREVTARGYALAILYPSDVVADRSRLAASTLDEIGGAPRAGALAVWAVLFSRAYDAIIQDARFDPERIAIWGHSRHGKAALLAGAFDPRFAAVIAHQSGRFGASPLFHEAGERRDQILRNYGYWFTPDLDEQSPLSVDQDQLIALNAPRPLLLGNGAGDRWSDPAGAWEALRRAHAAYALLGARGLTQSARDRPDFSGDLAYFQRSGGHGVTSADWRAFMAFLDAHLQPR
jgi:hypothetical protein